MEKAEHALRRAWNMLGRLEWEGGMCLLCGGVRPGQHGGVIDRRRPEGHAPDCELGLLLSDPSVLALVRDASRS
jgi:hypothetical protein